MHNGWVNYQTWLYNLHRGDDAYEQLQEWISEDYKEVFAGLSEKECAEKAVFLYAKHLKDYVMDEFFSVFMGISDAYISDVLTAALEEIDFSDIVRKITPDIIYQIRKKAP